MEVVLSCTLNDCKLNAGIPCPHQAGTVTGPISVEGISQRTAPNTPADDEARVRNIVATTPGAGIDPGQIHHFPLRWPRVRLAGAAVPLNRGFRFFKRPGIVNNPAGRRKNLSATPRPSSLWKEPPVRERSLRKPPSARCRPFAASTRALNLGGVDAPRSARGQPVDLHRDPKDPGVQEPGPLRRRSSTNGACFGPTCVLASIGATQGPNLVVAN